MSILNELWQEIHRLLLWKYMKYSNSRGEERGEEGEEGEEELCSDLSRETEK